MFNGRVHRAVGRWEGLRSGVGVTKAMFWSCDICAMRLREEASCGD